MKIKRFSLPILFSLLSASLFAEEWQPVDRIVALVDSDLILQSEITEKVDHGPLVKFSEYPETPKMTDFDRALNDAINVTLVLRETEKRDMQVKDEDVETYINQYVADKRITRKILEEELARDHRTLEQFKKEIRDAQLFNRFKGRVIIPLIKITDRELKAFYLSNNSLAIVDYKVTLQKIVIPIEDKMFVQEKEKLANQIYDRLKSDLPFAEAQSLYSNGHPSSDIVIPIGNLDAKIRGHFDKLKVGEFTKPMHMGGAFEIFYVKDMEMIESEDFTQQKDALERKLHKREVVRQTELWLQNERDRSKITIIKE